MVEHVTAVAKVICTVRRRPTDLSKHASSPVLQLVSFQQDIHFWLASYTYGKA
ncbi:hypothetical protein Tcan_11039 [Toxocara canis]|uniref:Uncharacterized protein n=1 Tax=Toxocara canis TaxID=6265 RepID=A0A0B2W4Y8_TOXCA|nr:hypothetical protein Tcan_11039 [Toxocara canis]